MDQMVALHVFRTVVEQGSFAAAARRMRLSPAAISKNISELEGHLNVRLLNRTTRRMSLTEPGRRYYEQVARILDDLAEADHSLGPLQSQPSGLLRVSAPMTFTLTRLSTAIPGFLMRHPDLSLDLQLDDRRVDIVQEGFDLAIRGSDRLEDSSLVARRLMTLHHVVCASPDYFSRRGMPRVPQDLRAHDCIQFTLSGHVSEWEFTRRGETVRVPIEGRYRVTSGLAIRDALLAGFGLNLIPRQYVAEDIRAGRLVTALDDWVPVQTAIHAVYPSRRYLLPKVRAFVEFLVDETRGET
ncbi:LysR family transcriptional regulator [Paracoccus binzhouensis]|uniref:LysR family transcriptional regulator n=1 Tax=Paracoccus binzhouensis TaxID=2796149 RepID=UPI0018EED458|nr:LysR family transcriptional regulator [Paracoccus binzhouensis]